ncbi:MAG: ABC transporter substrate-binding protein [Betaproteobacteria bacterium]
MARRRLLAAAAALTAAPWAVAQSQRRIPTLGILSPNRPPKGTQTPLVKHGWKPGETLLIEFPDAGGSEGRLTAIAAELVAKKVDVIWAAGPDAALAAARATSTIPIVFWGVLYPVEQGLIESFARPGRNVTGVAFTASPESDAKRLELLREIAPAVRRLGFLSAPVRLDAIKVKEAATRAAAAMREAARRLGYDFREFEVEKPGDLDAAFAAILDWRAEALMTQPSTLINRERKRIIDFANGNKLPGVFTLPEYVASGGLVAYAIDSGPTVARSFDYVDRILRGASPADLPVELPSKYVLAVNLRTAKLLGLSVPPSLLLRADRVIE